MDASLIPNVIKRFFGINDSTSPIVKVPESADIADNFELSQDFALTTRRGSMLLDYASRLSMKNNCAFVADQLPGVAGSLSIGTRYYIGRYRKSADNTFSLPTRAVVSVISTANGTTLVQITFGNNPDPRVYDEFVLYRTVAGADSFAGAYYPVTTFTALTLGIGFAHYQDGLLDATLDNGVALYLGTTGLDVDNPVAAIIDYNRRIGGRDLLFVSGKYIKSMETGNAIYDGLTKERIGCWLVYQNAVFYVNGKDFIMINANHQVYGWGGPAPNAAPQVARISGPLNGVYRWVYTFYDNGVVSQHPWEGNPSDVSTSVDLATEGAAITFADTNAPVRATHRKLYRTVSNGPIEEALLVSTIPIAELTFYDTFVDPVIGPDIVPFDYNDPPADLKLHWIIEKDDRIYGGGNPDSPGTIYWTRKGFPEQWSEVNNRLTLGDSDGDPLTGAGVTDGNLICFKMNSIYMVPDDPPLNGYKLGYKRGAQNFRCIQPVDNGLRVAADNSVYFFNGNAIEDCADYIATFFEEKVDPIQSTLKLSQVVEYSLPKKKQVIVLFKTTDQGIENSVAGVYHPYVVRQFGDPNMGWTFFKNFKACTLQVVKNSLNRDMLLLGGVNGKVYVHDSIVGQDRAEVLNFGAAGAPFVSLAVSAIAAWVEPFNNLTNWTLYLTSTALNIAPAGQLHVLSVNTLADYATLYTTNGTIASCQHVKLQVDNLVFDQLPSNPDAYNTLAIAFSVIMKTNSVENTAVTGSQMWFGVSPKGIWVNGFANSTGNYINALRYDFVAGVNYDIDFYLLTPAISDVVETPVVGSLVHKKFACSINGVGYYIGDVTGYVVDASTTTIPGAFEPSKCSLVLDCVNPSPANANLEFRINEITMSCLGEGTYPTAIEQPVLGEAIEYVYESPWISLDEFDDIQKFVKRLSLVLKANFNGDIVVTIYSDFIEANGSVYNIPVNGGSLWDVATWDKGIWDGIKETVGNRAGVNRVGKHFKIRITLSEISSYLEFYGMTVRRADENSLVAPKADEGAPE